MLPSPPCITQTAQLHRHHSVELSLGPWKRQQRITTLRGGRGCMPQPNNGQGMTGPSTGGAQPGAAAAHPPLVHPSAVLVQQPAPVDMLLYESHRRVSSDTGHDSTSSTPHLPAIPGAITTKRSNSNAGNNSNDVDQMARFATLNRSDSKKIMETVTVTDQAALDERRRQSIRKMEAMSNTRSVREAIQGAFASFTSGISPDADAETKLQQVLIAAKESGLTMERIFSFFSPSEETADIAEEDFVQGLQRLNSDTFSLTPTDMKMLVTKFDTNGDQKISLEEFVNFTLNIPHLTWRAERSRRRSGAPLTETERRLRGSRDQAPESSSIPPSARRSSKGIDAMGTAAARRASADRRGSRGSGALDLRGSIDRRPSARSSLDGKGPVLVPPASVPQAPLTPAGVSTSASGTSVSGSASGCPLVATSKLLESIAPVHELHRSNTTGALLPDMEFLGETAKLLWRVRENLVIRMYYHEPMPSTIAVVVHNEASNEDYPILYCSRDKIPIDDKAVEAAVAEKAIKLKGKEATTSDLNAEELSTAVAHARKEYMMSYLVQRLNVEDVTREDGSTGKAAVIKKQTGDEWETILCDKPAMVKAPPLIGGVTKATLAEFRRKSLDLEKMASEAKLHSNEASRLHQGAATNLSEAIPEGAEVSGQNA